MWSSCLCSGPGVALLEVSTSSRQLVCRVNRSMLPLDVSKQPNRARAAQARRRNRPVKNPVETLTGHEIARAIFSVRSQAQCLGRSLRARCGNVITVKATEKKIVCKVISELFVERSLRAGVERLARQSNRERARHCNCQVAWPKCNIEVIDNFNQPTRAPTACATVFRYASVLHHERKLRMRQRNVGRTRKTRCDVEKS